VTAKLDTAAVERTRNEFLFPRRADANALDIYQRMAGLTATYPGRGGPMGLIYTTLKLAGEAGEVSENVGKALRDDGFSAVAPFIEALVFCSGSPSFAKGGEAREGWLELCAPLIEKHSATEGELFDLRREALKKELGDVLWYVAAAAHELGYSLSDIAIANIEKLSDRQARGVLGGSGDER
jgi:NTP pyrophosphatase (non-canonical NTP hydrolase)